MTRPTFIGSWYAPFGPQDENTIIYVGLIWKKFGYSIFSLRRRERLFMFLSNFFGAAVINKFFTLIKENWQQDIFSSRLLQ